jgi:hypothetical protein
VRTCRIGSQRILVKVLRVGKRMATRTGSARGTGPPQPWTGAPSRFPCGAIDVIAGE